MFKWLVFPGLSSLESDQTGLLTPWHMIKKNINKKLGLSNWILLICFFPEIKNSNDAGSDNNSYDKMQSFPQNIISPLIEINCNKVMLYYHLFCGIGLEQEILTHHFKMDYIEVNSSSTNISVDKTYL
jgi:hypothetical protein